jgi:arylsulfatase A-like enzyme
MLGYLGARVGSHRLRLVIVSLLAGLVGGASATLLSPRDQAGVDIKVLGVDAADTTAAASQPNVLVIVTDDQRGGLGVMRKTLSWFGGGGTSFTQAYTATPLCCPARASLLTGRYSHNHGVTTNNDAADLDQRTTINAYLQGAGYRTGLFGKYLNSWPVTTSPPFWNEFAFFPQSNSLTYKGREWNVQGVVQDVDQYATDYIGQRATTFIQANVGRPWFLYLATPNAHGPQTPQPQYTEADVGEWSGNPAVFEADKRDKPPHIQTASDPLAEGQRLRTKQLRSLKSVDDMVDRVFEALESTGQLTNTLAFFVSDHGFYWAEHGVLGKAAPYLQGIKIPLFARWPGHFSSGSVDNRLASIIDIAPTILQAAGISANRAPIDGKSLLRDARRSRLYVEYLAGGQPKWSSILLGSSQYVEYRKDEFAEYYDLVRDPWQLENVLRNGVTGDEPANLSELSAWLALDMSCSGSSCP